jgi:tRNA nucleotidyltransferase (CCA-adding enzyme)
MAYNYFEGLIDPFGGEKDLRTGSVKCVGVPDDRFKEDALRMLRAIRFSSELNFSIDDKTFESIKGNSDLIDNVSKERISAEIIKILMSNNPTNILLLYHSGLMKHIIPSLERCFGVKQNNDFHKYDVGKHIIMSLLNSPKDLCVRIALMLHDIGKVDCKTTDENGTDHFYQHEIKSCDMAQEWMKAYRLDNDTIDQVSTLILYHDYFIDPSKRGIKRLLNAIGLDNTLKLLDIRIQDVKAQHEKYIESRLEKIDKIRKEIDEIVLKEEAFQLKDLLVNGNDLMNIGFEPGVKLGECLKYLLEIVIEVPSYNTKEKLLEIAKDKL